LQLHQQVIVLRCPFAGGAGSTSKPAECKKKPHVSFILPFGLMMLAGKTHDH